MSVNRSIILEKRDKLLIIKFNNVKRKNALDLNAYVEITKVLNEAATDESITTVAFTGVGEFYSSGNDMKARAANFSGDFEEQTKKYQTILINMFRAIFQFPKLLIAVVNGPCIGIAATTAALCDVIYCSETAYFYTPFTLMGLCAEGCSSYTFPRILGTSKASEMLLLNHKLTAEEAWKYTFVSDVFPPGDLERKIWPKIVDYSKLPLESVRAGKALIKKFQKDQLEKVLLEEIEELNRRWRSNEFFDALYTFINKKSKL